MSGQWTPKTAASNVVTVPSNVVVVAAAAVRVVRLPLCVMRIQRVRLAEDGVVVIDEDEEPAVPPVAPPAWLPKASCAFDLMGTWRILQRVVDYSILARIVVHTTNVTIPCCIISQVWQGCETIAFDVMWKTANFFFQERLPFAIH
jgi:hypothetical protein